MNLSELLRPNEILDKMHLAQTVNHRQPCFRCGRQLVQPQHYRVQTTGADGHYIGLQFCVPCQREMYAAAMKSKCSAGAPPVAPLTDQEKAIRPPQPIDLGSIYAPKRVDLFGPAPSQEND